MPDALVQLADRVWLFPADDDPTRWQPGVGVILGGGQTVLVDAGNSPQHARRVGYALRQIDAPPVSHIIFTQPDWDHTFGACAFDAPAIAHESCRDLLLERAPRPWGSTFIEDEIRRHPTLKDEYTALNRAMLDWHGFRVVVPRLAFTDRLTLYLDDLPVEAECIGGSVIVRAAGVVFLGDWLHSFTPGAAQPAFERVMAGNHTVYVDSRAPAPLTRDALSAWLARDL